MTPNQPDKKKTKASPAQMAALEKARAKSAEKRKAQAADKRKATRPAPKAKPTGKKPVAPKAKKEAKPKAREAAGSGSPQVRALVVAALQTGDYVTRKMLIDLMEQKPGFDRTTAGYAVTNTLRLLKRSGAVSSFEGKNGSRVTGAYAEGPNFSHLEKAVAGETERAYPKGAWE